MYLRETGGYISDVRMQECLQKMVIDVYDDMRQQINLACTCQRSKFQFHDEALMKHLLLML